MATPTKYAVAVVADLGETLGLMPLLKKLAQEGWPKLAVIAISKESASAAQRFMEINGANDGSWIVKMWTPETLGFDDSYTFVYGETAQEFTDDQLLKIQCCIGKPRLLLSGMIYRAQALLCEHYKCLPAMTTRVVTFYESLQPMIDFRREPFVRGIKRCNTSVMHELWCNNEICNKGFQTYVRDNSIQGPDMQVVVGSPSYIAWRLQRESESEEDRQERRRILLGDKHSDGKPIVLYCGSYDDESGSGEYTASVHMFARLVAKYKHLFQFVMSIHPRFYGESNGVVDCMERRIFEQFSVGKDVIYSNSKNMSTVEAATISSLTMSAHSTCAICSWYAGIPHIFVQDERNVSPDWDDGVDFIPKLNSVEEFDNHFVLQENGVPTIAPADLAVLEKEGYPLHDSDEIMLSRVHKMFS